MLPIVLTAGPLLSLAEGTVLGAVTYLVSRGQRSPLRSKR